MVLFLIFVTDRRKIVLVETILCDLCETFLFMNVHQKEHFKCFLKALLLPSDQKLVSKKKVVKQL